jgi:formylglycine-generating enzyme required for sulfatase activity
MRVMAFRRRGVGLPGGESRDYGALCARLAGELGPFGYQWLCACAVYPGLRLTITSYLGAKLATKVGRKAPPDEEEHMALARLPWFRAGWMPDELRLWLIGDLRPELRGVVREAIESLFFAAAERGEKPAPTDPPEVVRPPTGWISRFRDWLGAAPAEAPGGDMIFVRYMLGGMPRPGDFDLDRRLARVMGARLAGWLDCRTLAALTGAALAAVLIAWAGGLISSWFNAISYRMLRAEVVRECKDCPELVVLAGGTFRMGSNAITEAQPVHPVTVPPFAMGLYPVTFEEWDACVADGACTDRIGDGWGRGRRPVINVSWEGAQAYVSWLSHKTNRPYRLPSEAEWEYAARAGTKTAYPWGETWDPALANGADSVGRTTEVGAYPPNAFGLYDMIGNVWEWVEDCWHDNYDGAPDDGRAWIDLKNCNTRVMRGGSWYRDPAGLLVASRSSNPPAVRFNILGFRVARTLPRG